MVVFVCNGCGDTLKRTDVDKHSHKCKECQAVSCVDCNKDFFGSDYKKHMSCITEMEKYSGKDYIPKVAKGDAHQQNWTSHVKTVLESPTLPGEFTDIAQKLKSLTNIPRKKAKFFNFIKNCMNMNVKMGDRLDDLWKLIETANTLKSNQSKQKKNKSKPTDEVTGNAEKTNEVETNDNVDSHKAWIKSVRKNIKREKASASADIIPLLEELKKRDDIPRDNKQFIHYLQDKFGVRKTKTAYKLWTIISQTTSELNDSTINKEISDMEVIHISDDDKVKPNKRERKEQRQNAQTKKQKKDKTLAENVNVDGIPSETAESKEKKRKRKGADDSDEVLAKKSKENKENTGDASSSVNGIISQTEGPQSDIQDGEPTEAVTLHPKKFEWATHLLQKVRSSKSQEIKISRLKKSVIAECLSTCTIPKSQDSLEKYFNKALQHCNEVKVDKDRVMLKGDD